MFPILRFSTPLRLLTTLLGFALAAFPLFAAGNKGNSLLDESGNPAGFRTLAIGDAAPDFALPGIDGRTYRLSDFASADILMVLFTSNHCPTSHGIEQRLMKLRHEFRGRSFALIAINPNHPEGLSADELGYGEFNDSFEEMKPYAKKNGWDFPYVYDGEKQLTARAYGCLATPHVFIFDRQRKLRYAGRFDDSRFPQPETVKFPDARNALEALLAGQPVPVELTKPHGCSTKWREKHVTHVALETSWTKIPVAMEATDAAGIAALRANPTNKYRLFNVWATWCGPCVQEFPDIVGLMRKFDMRDFEVITISLDEPKQEAKAIAFLQKQGAGLTPRKLATVKREGRTTNHYLFSDASQDALMATLDPQWPGPIPHTVLVAPGGEIIWRHNGVIDRTDAIAAVVKAMTPYYQPAPAVRKTE
ncbi:MAG: redoxin domain-containing protein [Opitutaceae bacterium]|nr:redoxin domain-containing protein [Opitutaceae bacterium]